jgi:protein-S-isoprenylcysteine O-methyltransferase Ste14
VEKLIQWGTTIMPLTARKAFALFILGITAIIGASSFMAFLLYLYAGPLNWIHLGMNEVERLLFNALISVGFFLQHSIMIRKPFRRWLSVLIPAHYKGAVYTLASGFALLAFVAFWQGSDIILFDLQGLPGSVMRAFYFLSIIGTGWGMWALRSIDMFELDPIIENLRARPSPAIPFTIRGPYRWVRHPLYLFMIVLFWSCPLLTVDRLLFNLLWTIWVVIGTILEERDLADDFGDAYRDYQANVPMLVPNGFRPVCPAGKLENAA